MNALSKLALQLFATILGCTAVVAQDTSMFRNDSAHSGIYAGGLPKLHGVKWTFHTHGEVTSSPAIVQGVVYVGSNDGNLYAIDRQKGSLIWKFPTEARITSSSAVAYGLA